MTALERAKEDLQYVFETVANAKQLIRNFRKREPNVDEGDYMNLVKDIEDELGNVVAFYSERRYKDD